MRLPLPSRRLAAAALALSALMTVSACGRVTAGSAAVVDGTRISVNDLQTASTEIAGVFGEQPGNVQQAVLGWMVLGEYSVPVAEEYGIGVSEEEVRTWFADSTEQGTSALPSAATVRAFQGLLSLQALAYLSMSGAEEAAEQAFAEVVDGIKSGGLKVNPRYGTLRLAELTSNTLLSSLLQRNGILLPLFQESPDWLVSSDSE